jgi:hypothetical protein
MAESKWFYANKSTRNISALVIGLGILGTALFLVLGRKFGLDARPGFFGTYAPLYSDINLVVEMLMVIGLISGYILIRNKIRSGHQYMQTAMVLLNLVMTIFFMALVFVQLLKPGTVLSISVLAEIAHGTVGVIAVLTGLYLLLAMNDLLPKSWQIKNWKNLMRFAIWAYGAVALGGIAVYALFFLGLKF